MVADGAVAATIGDQFSLVAERESLTGSHRHYVQTCQGLPAYGTYAQVHLDLEDKVENVAHLTQALSASARALDAKLDQETAIGRASQELEPPVRVAKSIAGQVVFAEGGTPRLAWKVVLDQRAPFAVWEIVVAADDGAVLKKRDIAMRADGKGYVFVPNPVDTAGKFDLSDDDNNDSEFLTAQRKEVVLTDLDGKGSLTGTYATTTVPSDKERATNKDLVFDYTRSQDAFEETMVYYHITAMQHYLQGLGFKAINNRQITVNVNTIDDDNSFYSPSDKEITFGIGGVDDAEDAAVIYHEAGHAIHDNQVLGWGSNNEGRAIGEGFGDYWAASNFNKPDYPYIATWDGTSYNPGKPAFLRRLDTTKKYPDDMHGEVHDDGEIWSASLWQIFGIIGKTRTDAIVLEAHFQLTPNTTFAQNAAAIIAANDKLYKSADGPAIKKVFGDRGIIN